MLQQHIQTDPSTGKPCIAGTGIRVWDIYVLHERQGRMPDEIVAAYPHVTLADVHAALAYYWDNKDEIDRQMKEADEFIEQLKAANGPGPLARKLAAGESGRDKVSS
ncbi:MAG: DUF433 domain-containing protein [Planctomycetes bacterium]|nr:DUF433 domain-containing protein [Planctomycetota bacterium]